MFSVSQLLLIVGITLIVYSFYKWATINNDYFKKRRIPFIKPYFLLGNTAAIFFNTQTLFELISNLYGEFPNEKIIGFFNFRTPIYLIRDPELAKKIMIKDFDYFVDRKSLIDSDMDRLLGSSVLLMKGQRWRDMRATLSPAFTGLKMRQMFTLLADCAEQISNHLLMHQSTNPTNIDEKKPQILQMKDLFSRYANDIIASCAFGINVNSLTDKNNEFLTIGKMMLNFHSIKSFVKFFILRITPKWFIRFFDIQFIDNKIKTYFTKIILETMSYRQQNNILRSDMINILLEIKRGQLQYNKNVEHKNYVEGFATVEESTFGQRQLHGYQWTDYEMIAQCFVFFLAGYDASSSFLCAIVYELAMNPDIQNRLINEIDNYKVCGIHNNNNDGRLTYDDLQRIKYLDMIISETLRLWSPAAFTDRQCGMDYLLCTDDSDDNDTENILMTKGQQIWIPLYGFHMDPKYYPNPQKFDPERFNDENKLNINSLVYLPFGSGPRNCIGSRFAIMQFKVIIYYLLKKFTFNICEKTQIPLVYKNSPLGLYPGDGLYLELRPRQNN